MITHLTLEVMSNSAGHDLAIRAVDRLNLLTGVFLLSCGLYLRFVARYKVPRVYEYAYLLAGATFFATGMFYAGDPDIHVLAVRVARQASVIFLAYAMFHHLVITTNIDPPSKRIPEAIRDVLN